jgi:hypothetical protein
VRGQAAWHEHARRAPHPPPNPPPPADALFDDLDAADAVKPTPPSCGSPTHDVTAAEDGGLTTGAVDDGMGLVCVTGDDTRGKGGGGETGTALALRSGGASGGDGGEDGGHESGDESDDGGGDEGEGATGTVNDYLPPGTAAHAAPGGAPPAAPAATPGLLTADAERLAAHLLPALAAPAGAAASTAGGGGGGGGVGAASLSSGAPAPASTAPQGSEDQAAAIAAAAASTAAALTTSGGTALNTTAALTDALIAHMTAAITTAQSADEARDRLAHLLHAVVAGLSNDDDKVAFLSRVLVVMRAAAMHSCLVQLDGGAGSSKRAHGTRRFIKSGKQRVRRTMETIALHLAKAVLGYSRRDAKKLLPALLPPLVQRRRALPPSSAASSPAPAHAMARRSAAAAVASPAARPAAGATTTTRGIPAATPSRRGGDVDDGSSGAGGRCAGLLSPLRGAQSTATAATTAAGSRALTTSVMEQGGGNGSGGGGGGAAPLLVNRRAASPPASGAAGGTRAPSASPPTARPPAATPSAGRPRAPASSSVAAPRPRPPAGSGKEAPSRPGAARADRPGGGAAAAAPAPHLPRAAKFGGLIGAPNTLGMRGPVRIPPPPSPPLPGEIVEPDGALVVAPTAAVWSCERDAEWLAATEEAALVSRLSAAAAASALPPAPAPSAAGAARGGAGAAPGGAGAAVGGAGGGAPDYWAVEGRLTFPGDYPLDSGALRDSKQAHPPFCSFLGQRRHDGAGDVIQLRDVDDVLVSGRGGGAGGRGGGGCCASHNQHPPPHSHPRRTQAAVALAQQQLEAVGFAVVALSGAAGMSRNPRGLASITGPAGQPLQWTNDGLATELGDWRSPMSMSCVPYLVAALMQVLVQGGLPDGSDARVVTTGQVFASTFLGDDANLSKLVPHSLEAKPPAPAGTPVWHLGHDGPPATLGDMVAGVLFLTGRNNVFILPRSHRDAYQPVPPSGPVQQPNTTRHHGSYLYFPNLPPGTLLVRVTAPRPAPACTHARTRACHPPPPPAAGPPAVGGVVLLPGGGPHAAPPRGGVCPPRRSDLAGRDERLPHHQARGAGYQQAGRPAGRGCGRRRHLPDVCQERRLALQLRGRLHGAAVGRGGGGGATRARVGPQGGGRHVGSRYRRSGGQQARPRPFAVPVIVFLRLLVPRRLLVRLLPRLLPRHPVCCGRRHAVRGLVQQRRRGA